MGDLSILAWILIAVAFVVGGGIGFATRRPKTIVEDADAKREEHLALRNAALEAELQQKAADTKAWADSHAAVVADLESTKEQLEAATTPPELVEARDKVETLTTELEEAKERVAQIESLNAELDTARGRAAALERELATAKSVPQVPVEDFAKAAALEERNAVLEGELKAAKMRISELESQLAD